MNDDLVSWPFARPRPGDGAGLLDIAPEYRRLRERRPIVRVRLPDGGRAWLLTRYPDVRAALADPRLSASTDPLHRHGGDAATRIGALAHTDPPEHARYRAPLDRAFGAGRIRARLPSMVAVVEERIAAMAAAPDRRCDLVRAFAIPVPLRIIGRLLGLPDEEHDGLRQAAERLLTIGLDPGEAGPAAAAMLAHMRRIVTARRRAPRDDLMSELTLHSALTDAEIADLGATLVLGGYETLAASIGTAVATLLEHPDQRAAFLADERTRDRAVEELLRYTSVVQYGVDRVAAHDLRLGDARIRAGERVIAFLPSANRDHAHHSRADDLDTGRRPLPHLAFGHGAHRCVGQHLARVELRLALPRLLRRFPDLRADPDRPAPVVRRDRVFGGPDALPVMWRDSAPGADERRRTPVRGA
ncbi:cytochrome P450 [Embleya hyalina]|uniref:Cytochrome P450 n=1 Tax=Embleya hyalina TaxID=516124 RepID=A0A401YM66_9ACTN|nr:cytochrome P450 [Embleya hyalina]GCD95681.1 cytochrome P450 [Embleya hyalina]